MTVWLGHSCPSALARKVRRVYKAGRADLESREGRPYTIACEKDEYAGEGARAILLT